MKTMKTWDLDEERSERIRVQVLENVDTDPRGRYYDEIGAYMAQLRQYPTLRAQEDFDRLFEGYLRPRTDEEKLRYRDLLVYGNIRLVLSVGLRHTGRGLPLLDLLQEGVLGLMIAIDKFDPTKGYRFSTYAMHWIRQAMSRAIYETGTGRSYRVPVHAAEKLSLVKRVTWDAYAELGRWPNDLEVFERVRALETKVAQTMRLNEVVRYRHLMLTGKETRLDAPLPSSDEEDGETIGEYLVGGPPKTETLVEAGGLLAEYRDALARVEEAISRFPPRTAMVLRLRFGLGEFDAMTFEEISERYGVTRERIRQIEAKGLEQLQEAFGITAEQIQELVDVAAELETIVHAI